MAKRQEQPTPPAGSDAEPRDRGPRFGGVLPPAKRRQFAVAPPQMTILSDHAILREDEQPDDREHDYFMLHSRLGAVYDIIRHRNTRAPLAVAVYGDWGAGKSSAMRWLIDQLDTWKKDGEHGGHFTARTVWFDPWKFTTREDVWRGLIAEVILNSIDPKKASLPTVQSAARKFGLFLGRSFLNVLASLELTAGATPIGGEATVNLEALTKIAEDYHKTAHPEKAYLNEFERELKSWVKASLGQQERMVVFIDDLDRCLPAVTLEVLEALKLYLNIPQLIFVVGLDRAVVAAVVRKHYREAGVDELKADRYLDKIFQVEVDVPPSQLQMRGYLEAQIAAIGRATDDYWSRSLEGWERGHRAVIESKIGALAEGNPREVKRLLNSTLQRGVGAARHEELGASDAQRFTQGCQVFLMRVVLDRYVPESGGLLLQTEALDFFEQWSQFIAHFPTFRPGAGDAPPGAGDAVADADIEERAAGPQSGKSEGGDPEARAEYEKLRAAQPRYRGKDGRDEPYPLLQQPDLWDLLAIPFSAAVAAAAVSPAPAEADAAEPEVEAQPAAAPARGRRGAPPLDLPPSVLSAAARALGKSVAALGREDLARVTSLDLSGADIRDVSPLAQLANLQRLFLHGTQVSDVNPLAQLANLRTLHLGSTQVSDVSPLAQLANLRKLYLTATQVRDVGPLEQLANLQVLGLRDTQVSDVRPLAQLANLQTLRLGGTQVRDVKPLAQLANLQTLNLGGTQVSDVSPLAQLANLQTLYLAATQVRDVSPLAQLANLQALHLDHTPVCDVSPLAQLANLQTLDLGGTQVSDVGPLERLANLQMLILFGTQVSDVNPLAQLANLQWLNLTGTQVSDVGPLEKLANVQTLYLGGTQVSDVSPLARLADLQTLDLRVTQASKETVAALRAALPNCNILY